MADNNLQQAQSGAATFALDALKKGYFVGLIQFADCASCLCAPTKDISHIQVSLQNLTADGGTNMTAAVQLAVEDLISKVECVRSL